MSKVSDMKQKKVPTKKPSATPSAPARRSPMVPFYGAASTAGDVFDERAGSYGSNNAAAEFVNLLATNAVDIDQAPITDFYYNEMEGGIDDDTGEDEVEEAAATTSADSARVARRLFRTTAPDVLRGIPCIPASAAVAGIAPCPDRPICGGLEANRREKEPTSACRNQPVGVAVE
ncbi:galacturonosyltransferase 14 [Hordeum vulgare]|nr:galacturonosyltransferase 14 [Hordeum vulgare]